MANIAIVGAGVVGLSTAMNIMKRLPTARLTVFADRFDNETTSSGAGGLFRPNVMVYGVVFQGTRTIRVAGEKGSSDPLRTPYNVEHIPGVDPDTIRRWSQVAFDHYSRFATSPESRDVGHMVSPGYVFNNTPLEDPLYKGIVFSFHELSPTALHSLGVDYKYGYQVTTVVRDMSRYLPWLMTRFKESGGQVVNKTIGSLEEFVGQYDLVVNCSGLRARELVGDDSMYPIRGHLVKVKAPWMKYWVYTEDLAYFVPGFDGVSLGGIRQRGNYSREVDPADTQGILERCFKVCPALKGAEIIRSWVDLRPHRDPIRVEKETMKFTKGSIPVVHNYGHGGNGVTLSWGTSIDAANLVVEALQGHKSKL